MVSSFQGINSPPKKTGFGFLPHPKQLRCFSLHLPNSGPCRSGPQSHFSVYNYHDPVSRTDHCAPEPTLIPYPSLRDFLKAFNYVAIYTRFDNREGTPSVLMTQHNLLSSLCPTAELGHSGDSLQQTVPRGAPSACLGAAMGGVLPGMHAAVAC